MGLPKTIPSPEDARLIDLGRQAEDLFASDEPSPEFRAAMKPDSDVDPVRAAYLWFRERILGEHGAAPTRTFGEMERCSECGAPIKECHGR